MICSSSFLFKAEIKGLRERNYIRMFEKKWNEGALHAVNCMLDCAEEDNWGQRFTCDLLSSIKICLQEDLSASAAASEKRSVPNLAEFCKNDFKELEGYVLKDGPVKMREIINWRK
jgi:ribonuclease I